MAWSSEGTRPAAQRRAGQRAWCSGRRLPARGGRAPRLAVSARRRFRAARSRSRASGLGVAPCSLALGGAVGAAGVGGWSALSVSLGARCVPRGVAGGVAGLWGRGAGGSRWAWSLGGGVGCVLGVWGVWCLVWGGVGWWRGRAWVVVGGCGGGSFVCGVGGVGVGRGAVRGAVRR